MKKVVIGLSGGLDSTTLLTHLIASHYEVHCCIFTYGSKHNKYENKAAANIVDFYQKRRQSIISHFFNLEEVFKPFQSDLLLSGGEIPEGHYEADSMKKTVVPGRNMIFAAIMAGLAETIGAEAIALGVHAGDHAIYPDCRPEFIKALDMALYLSTDKKMEVMTPFIKMTKTQIVIKAIRLQYNFPFELTRTCYKDQPIACGKCGSCQERIEAFKIANVVDPIEYE